MRLARSHAGSSLAIACGFASLALLILWLSIPGRSDAVIPAGTDGAGVVAARAAAARTVSGYVFYDKNDNGVRDPGEPGVAGIRLRDNKGAVSATTGSDGSYAFASVPSSGYLQVETGWFRSQCPPASSPTATSCGVGPGKDNDFLVDNQFVRYTLTGTSASGIDVGLVPDWPGGSMTIPAPVAGVVPANAVDVAARLSWVSGTCVSSTYEICRAGDTFSMAGQVLNEGTTALTGVQARVYVPPGDCVVSASLLAYTAPIGLGALTVTPATPTCSDRYLDLSFAGSLAPGAGVRVLINGKTVSGPGTPGCTTTKTSALTCPTAEPQGRGWLLGVSHIDQTGDPDSTFCAAGDMTLCPTGLHDKRHTPDEVDPAGHNVDAALTGTSAYDLAAHVEKLSDDTVRAWVSNPSDDGAAPIKSVVKIWLPAGTSVVAVPAKHTLLTCDAGKVSGSAVVVTCTLGGPVGPTISSPAIDITLGAAPARVVVCATPPSGAAAETIPAATGCGLTTDAETTATDNDATFASS